MGFFYILPVFREKCDNMGCGFEVLVYFEVIIFISAIFILNIITDLILMPGKFKIK